MNNGRYDAFGISGWSLGIPTWAAKFGLTCGFPVTMCNFWEGYSGRLFIPIVM